MTQFTTQEGDFLKTNRHIYDVMYLANNANGDVVSTANPLPVTLGSESIILNGNVIVKQVEVTNDVGTPLSISANNLPNAPGNPIYVEISNDTGNAIPISVNGSPNAPGNPIYAEVSNDIGNPLPVNMQNLPEASVTAFEEPLSVSITPVIQSESIYGLDPDYWSTSSLYGGSVTNANSTFLIQSGTNAGGYARLATKKYVNYKPGQGLMFRWTAAYTANGTTRDAYGVDNIVQNAGPIDREDGYSIGYSGSTANNASRKIGILHRLGGKAEIRELIITTAPTGTQTATITLDGIAYTATINASSNTVFTTHELAAKLRANTIAENTWDIEACDSIISFSYYSPGPRTGTFSFSSTGAGTLAAGNFTTIQTGRAPTDEWTYVDSWNGTTIPNFDPTKLNVYGMDMRWLGSGRVRFFMEDPATGKMVLIHTQKSSGISIMPHILKPSLRMVYRSGTTNPNITPSQNVILRGSSIMGAIQGQIIQTGVSHAYYSTATGNRSADTTHHLLSIQNPYIRNGMVNKSSLIIQDLAVSAQGNDPSVVFIVKNAVGTSGYLLFNPLPNTTNYNFAQYSVNAVTEDLTKDVINNIQTLGINTSAKFDLLPYNLTLVPGEYISVFIISTSILSRTAAGISWRVD